MSGSIFFNHRRNAMKKAASTAWARRALPLLFIPVFVFSQELDDAFGDIGYEPESSGFGESEIYAPPEPPPPPQPPPADAKKAEAKKEKPKVAIGAIAVGYEDNSNALKGLRTELTKAIVNSGKYTAVDRSEDILMQLGKEHGYQRGGAVDNDQIKKLGVQFGVQYMCFVESSSMMGSYMLSARFVDVETAEIPVMGSVSSNLSGIDELVRVAEEISHQLLGRPSMFAKKSFWLALAMEAGGAALVSYAFVNNQKVAKRRDEYNSLARPPATQPDLDKAWGKVEDAKTMRNMSLGIGAALLATGIGVHIWF